MNSVTPQSTALLREQVPPSVLAGLLQAACWDLDDTLPEILFAPAPDRFALADLLLSFEVIMSHVRRQATSARSARAVPNLDAGEATPVSRSTPTPIAQIHHLREQFDALAYQLPAGRAHRDHFRAVCVAYDAFKSALVNFLAGKEVSRAALDTAAR